MMTESACFVFEKKFCYNLELFRTLVRDAIGAFGKRRVIKLSF